VAYCNEPPVIRVENRGETALPEHKPDEVWLSRGDTRSTPGQF